MLYLLKCIPLWAYLRKKLKRETISLGLDIRPLVGEVARPAVNTETGQWLYGGFWFSSMPLSWPQEDEILPSQEVLHPCICSFRKQIVLALLLCVLQCTGRWSRSLLSWDKWPCGVGVGGKDVEVQTGKQATVTSAGAGMDERDAIEVGHQGVKEVLLGTAIRKLGSEE